MEDALKKKTIYKMCTTAGMICVSQKDDQVFLTSDGIVTVQVPQGTFQDALVDMVAKEARRKEEEKAQTVEEEETKEEEKGKKTLEDALQEIGVDGRHIHLSEPLLKEQWGATPKMPFAHVPGSKRCECPACRPATEPEEEQEVPPV
jgi:hypothetical protein